MLPRLKTLGYRQIRLTEGGILGPAGSTARGHEFHYSEIAAIDPGQGMRDDCYQARGRAGDAPQSRGFGLASTLASYIHLHFGSNPDLAPALVRSCAAWKESNV
jgi:cobyrinic acid a,c-diamide synthase